MRIGFDGRWYNGSGVGTYVRELLNAIAEISHEFEIVVFEHSGNAVPTTGRAGISRVTVQASKFSPMQFELRSLCRSLKIDFFHVPYQYGAPMLLPCPLIVTVHDLIPFLLRTRSWHKQLLAVPVVRLGYRLAAARARHVIVDSINTARDVEEILGVPRNRVTPIYLAASDLAFREVQTEGEEEALARKYGVRSPYVVVGSAGNWRTKNLETALRVLAEARNTSGMDFQTVVYGPSKGLDVIAERIGGLRLDICRTGYLPVDDLAALFRYARLFLMSSLYEGFGLPLVEAMACGCPVVTSSGGSLGEVAGDGAMVFDPSDVQGMARAVALLLSNHDEHERWRARGLRRAKEFSWRDAAEQTLSVYRKVCRTLHKSKTKTCLQP